MGDVNVFRSCSQGFYSRPGSGEALFRTKHTPLRNPKHQESMADAVTTTDKPKVVIIGGNFGGLGAGKAFSDLNTHEVADVTIIEATDSFPVTACWQFASFSKDAIENTSWPLSEVQMPGVNMMLNTPVQTIDTASKTLNVTNAAGEAETISYDYLVMATGARSDRDAIPGLADRTIDLADPTGTLRIKEKVDSITSGTISIVVCEVPYKCPPVPFEFAFLIDDHLKQRGVRDQVKIQVIVPVPFPFGGPPIAEVFKGVMEEKGIEFVPEFKVCSASLIIINGSESGVRSLGCRVPGSW